MWCRFRFRWWPSLVASWGLPCFPRLRLTSANCCGRMSLPLASAAADLRFPFPSFLVFFSSGGGDGAPTPTPLAPKTSFPCGGPVSFFRRLRGCDETVEVAEVVLLMAGARGSWSVFANTCAAAGGAGGTPESVETAAHVGALCSGGGAGTGAGLPHIAASDACPWPLLLPAPFAGIADGSASGCSVDIRCGSSEHVCAVVCEAADLGRLGAFGQGADEGRKWRLYSKSRRVNWTHMTRQLVT